jgi:MFS family permease
LDDDPSKMEWDLLAQEALMKSEREERKRLDEIKVEKDKLQKIREKLGEIEGRLDEIKKETPSFLDSLRIVFSWRNYSIYLVTSWIFTAFSYLGLFFNLYLLKLNWEYVLIGTVLSITSAISATSRLIGGYVGDVSNRKHLSVVAMFMMAVYNLILGIFTEFSWIILALLFFSTMDVFKGGSTAYIMDNIPKEHSGVGISFFSAGRVFGIITLGVFVVLTQMNEFGSGLRSMFLTGGLFLVGASIVRAIFLEGKTPEVKREGVSLVRFFIQDNKRAAGLLLKAVPGMIAIAIIDSLSDSLFSFGAYIYIYQDLHIEIPGLILMSLVTILVSVPLLLGSGRLSDRRGERITSLIVYSVMPICTLLLLIAPIFPYWVPQSVIDQAESLFPGLGAVFSTSFLALVMKSVNDAMWNLLLLTIIQKNLPRRDTSKILGMFWFIVYLFASIGPFFGGIVFHYFPKAYLFIVIFVLNLIILGWIATKGLVKTEKEAKIVNDGEIDEHE